MKDFILLFIPVSIFIGLLLLVNLLTFNSTNGVVNNEGVEEVETFDKTEEVKRFVAINRLDDFYIVYDTLTKVQYAVSSGVYNKGILVLLVDSDGKPLLYEE